MLKSLQENNNKKLFAQLNDFNLTRVVLHKHEYCKREVGGGGEPDAF